MMLFWGSRMRTWKGLMMSFFFGGGWENEDVEGVNDVVLGEENEDVEGGNDVVLGEENEDVEGVNDVVLGEENEDVEGVNDVVLGVENEDLTYIWSWLKQCLYTTEDR